MKQAQFQKLMLTIGVVIMATVITGVVVMCCSNNRKEEEPSRRQESPAQTSDKICLTLHQFERLQKKQDGEKEKQASVCSAPHRDIRVIRDPLYPPLNRTDRATHENLKTMLPPIQSTRPEFDTFRLIGYLKSTAPITMMEPDSGNNTWKLFGRMKDRNLGEFYMSPANNQDDIKIPITPEIVKSERIRDVYTIPAQIVFDSPLLHKTPYVFVELPKGDFTGYL